MVHFFITIYKCVHSINKNDKLDFDVWCWIFNIVRNALKNVYAYNYDLLT